MFRIGYSAKMTADTEAEVTLYGQIISDMPEEWKWSKEDKSAADFKKAIDELKKKGAKSLLVRINSPGGICTEAVAMRSILSNAGFEDITIRIEGMCASAATTIATIPNATVQITEGSEYMIHNPWTLAIGNANEIMHEVEHLRNIEEMTRGFYAKKTGQSDDQIKQWMDDETWFTAEQAVEYGFADELLETEAKAAACVTSQQMATMKGLYKSVPENLTVQDTITLDACVLTADAIVTSDDITVSNGTQVAGEPSEIKKELEENPTMELKDLTLDQLRDECPALYDEIVQSAVSAERTRLSDIDALTIPGYEDMAEKAKAEGTSAMEFQKAIVAAMREKGASFLASRTAETAPAQEVAGDAPSGKTDEQEIKDAVASIVEFAKSIDANGDSMF